MVRTLTLLLLAAAALAVPAVAGAPTYVLGWHETDVSGGRRVATFDVASLTRNATGWELRASMRNDSRFAERLTRANIAVAVFTRIRPTDCTRFVPLEANTFSPRFPILLGPGQRWNGTIRGDRPLPVGGYVRVVFAQFAGGDPLRPRWTWLTDHVLTVATGRSGRVAGFTCK